MLAIMCALELLLVDQIHMNNDLFQRHMPIFTNIDQMMS